MRVITSSPGPIRGSNKVDITARVKGKEKRVRVPHRHELEQTRAKVLKVFIQKLPIEKEDFRLEQTRG